MCAVPSLWLTAAADGQRAAVGFHVERVADQSFDVGCAGGGFGPLFGVDGLAGGGLVPDAQCLAAEAVLAELALACAACWFRWCGAGSSGWLSSIGRGRRCRRRGRRRIPRRAWSSSPASAWAAAFRERFAGVGGARWGADVEDERVGAGVGGGHHVADGLFGQDLCFVEHDDVYGVVASGEALGSCAEQYLAAVGEGDFLHAVAAAHAVGAAGVVEVSDERGVAYQGAHVVERVAVGAVVVCGPDDGQVGDERAQDDHEAGDGEGLAGLAADAQHHAADGGGERAVCSSAEDDVSSPCCQRS